MPRSPIVILILAIALLGLVRRGAAEVREDLPPRLRLASATASGGG